MGSYAGGARERPKRYQLTVPEHCFHACRTGGAGGVWHVAIEFCPLRAEGGWYSKLVCFPILGRVLSFQRVFFQVILLDIGLTLVALIFGRELQGRI